MHKDGSLDPREKLYRKKGGTVEELMKKSNVGVAQRMAKDLADAKGGDRTRYVHAVH